MRFASAGFVRSITTKLPGTRNTAPSLRESLIESHQPVSVYSDEVIKKEKVFGRTKALKGTLKNNDHKSRRDTIHVILSYAMSPLTKFEMPPNEAAPSGG